MAELMLDVITSLDGYGAAEGWPGLWGLGGPEYVEWVEQENALPRTVLLGATSYRLMQRFLSSREPGVDLLNAIPKVVFSSTLDAPVDTPNTTLVRGDAIEAVRAMKAERDRPLRTWGSFTLGRSLLEAGLVDRYRVVVFPVVTGKTGRDPVYRGWPDVALELIESRTFDGRSQLLDYRPRLLDEPLPPGMSSAVG